MHRKLYSKLGKLLKQSSQITFKLIFLLLPVVLLFTCNNNKAGEPIPLFEYNDSISEPFIAFDTAFDKENGYRSIKFMTNYEEWPIPLQAKLFEKNKAFWVSLNQPNQDTFKLFDFKLKLKKPEMISWKILAYDEYDTLVEKRHKLVLQNKFYDKSLHDSVYQFRLDSIGLIGEHDNLVCFVTKKHWIVGFYAGEYFLENDSIIELAVPCFGNIYKDKLDYSNVDFNHRLL